MSLGKYKTRSEAYSETFGLEWEKEAGDWYGDSYYDWWDADYDDYCEKPCCMADYSYRENIYGKHLRRRAGGVYIDEQMLGSLIDMDTIYLIGTVCYRNRVIDMLLGERTPSGPAGVRLGDYLGNHNIF